MGGCAFENDSELGDYDIVENDAQSSCAGKVINIVLVGRTGNGKSATGNSILRNKAFISKNLPCSVTTECQQQHATLDDGSILNVIDTPGLFDTSNGFKHVAVEIARCVSMAEGGIHAVLVVLSLGRFTEEEGAVVKQLESIFGEEIYDYMIVLFTRGDDLEDETLDVYIAQSPAALKELLGRCGGRTLAFDNRTRDDIIKSQQISQLLNLVEDIAKTNGGKPYSNDFFLEYQKGVEQLFLEKAAALGSNEEEFEMSKLLEEAKQDQVKSLSMMVVSKLTSLEEETCKLRQELSRSTVMVTKLESDLAKMGEKERKIAEYAKKIEEERKKAEEKAKKSEEQRKKAEEMAKKAEQQRKKQESEMNALRQRVAHAENRPVCAIM